MAQLPCQADALNASATAAQTGLVGATGLAGNPLEGVHDEAEASTKYLSLFADEAETAVDSLTEALLRLEAGKASQDLVRLLVASHRIKGAAASVGLHRAARLTHFMEDLLQRLTDTGSAPSAEGIDAMLKCTDALRGYVENLKCGKASADHFDDAAVALARALTSMGGVQTGELASRDACGSESRLAHAGALKPEAEYHGSPAVSAELKTKVAGMVSGGVACLVGQVIFVPHLPGAGLRARLVYERISSLGEVCYLDPPVECLEGLARLDHLDFGLVTDTPPDAIAPRVWTAGVQTVLVEPLPGAQSGAEAGAGQALEGGMRPMEIVRVEIERLEDLTSLAGRLAICKARLAQLSNTLRSTLKHHEAIRSIVDNLSEAVQQLDQISNGIQQSVAETRMVSMEPLVTRIKRIVREVTRSSGKAIGLAVHGEKTELDKRLIDELSDPLIQLVRNAADHGIESPGVRQAMGKSPEGTIAVDVLASENAVVIRVSDDGAGLDTDGILRTALEKGLLGPAEVEGMSPTEIGELIWHSGLSTSERVTEVSGRGLGMDIVKSKVAGLHGTVALESQRGKGTTVSIRLPATLSVRHSLLVDVAGEVYALPVQSVAAVVRVAAGDVIVREGRWGVWVGGRVVSLLRLKEIASPWTEGTDEDGGQSVVIVRRKKGGEIGLLVDSVIGETDVLFRLHAGESPLADKDGGAGVADGGGWRILDVEALASADGAVGPSPPAPLPDHFVAPAGEGREEGSRLPEGGEGSLADCRKEHGDE